MINDHTAFVQIVCSNASGSLVFVSFKLNISQEGHITLLESEKLARTIALELFETLGYEDSTLPL